MNAPTYAELATMIAGLAAADMSAISKAEVYSRERLERARLVLARLPAADAPGMGAIAFGSLGRFEASPQSDLDLAFLFDGRVVDVARARDMRSRCVKALSATFDIPEKTFDEALDVRTLVRHVGGDEDTHAALTHRALLLTEGLWLHDPGGCEAMKEIVFSVYARGSVTRGRFLTSLTNDLHRYYRTVCVDYRFKVEEETKSWATRVLKLRHSRKLWHLANVCLQCWAVDAADEQRDAFLAERLDWPPLVRIALAMAHFGAPKTVPPVFRAYDRFLEAMSSGEVRDELASLSHADRWRSDIYRAMHQNAAAIDDAAAAVVEVLWARCRTYLLRFCIL